MIAMYLKRYRDVQISQISQSGVWRILQRVNLARLPAYQRYQRAVEHPAPVIGRPGWPAPTDRRQSAGHRLNCTRPPSPAATVRLGVITPVVPARAARHRRDDRRAISVQLVFCVPAGTPCGRENRGWLPADAGPPWCCEPVNKSGAGSCLHPSTSSPTSCCPTRRPLRPISARTGTTASPRYAASASSSPSCNACPARRSPSRRPPPDTCRPYPGSADAPPGYCRMPSD
jgi:hypothetical protein